MIEKKQKKNCVGGKTRNVSDWKSSKKKNHTEEERKPKLKIRKHKHQHTQGEVGQMSNRRERQENKQKRRGGVNTDRSSREIERNK